MGIFNRRDGGAEAVHARTADGEHLWLAVRGADEPLLLVRDGGPDVEVGALTERHGDEVLLTAVVPVAAALAADDSPALELRLVHGRRRRPVRPAWDPRPASPTLEAPTTVDRRWQLSVHGDGDEVVVRRAPVAPAVVVLAVVAADDGVAVRLGGDVGEVTVGATTLPVTDGVVLVGEVPDLPLETNIPVLCDGMPVVRRRNVVDRPHFAAAFPPLPVPEVELRWLRDGRLALFRRETALVRPA